MLHKSIGDVALDQTKAQVDAALGAGTLVTNNGTYREYRYEAAKLKVGYFRFEDGCLDGSGSGWCVMIIHTASTRYSTLRGVKVGITRARLRSLLPRVRTYVDPRGTVHPNQLLLPNPTAGGLFAPGTLFYTRAGKVTGVRITHSYEA